MSKRTTTVPGTRIGARTAKDVMPRTLELADAAAKRRDYAEALGWLDTLEANGYQLEPAYEYKRARWRLKLKGGRTESSQWFG